MRGSDADAAIYYLAAMLEGGEDPKFIARRMIVFASEDVGNADPTALLVAVAASRAVEWVGCPSAASISVRRRPICRWRRRATRLTKLSTKRAAEVRRHGNLAPPLHLRSSNYPGARKLGHGAGYKYPHATGGWVEQQYLPDALVGQFVLPVDHRRGRAAADRTAA